MPRPKMVEAIMPSIDDLEALGTKIPPVPDIPSLINSYWEKRELDILRLVDIVSHSIHGVTEMDEPLPTGIPKFIGLHGKTLALFPTIQGEFKQYIELSKDEKMWTSRQTLEKALVAVEKLVEPQAGLAVLWSGQGETVWKFTTAPPLYVYLAPWLTTSTQTAAPSRVNFQEKPHVLFVIPYQPRASFLTALEKHSGFSLKETRWEKSLGLLNSLENPDFQLLMGQRHQLVDKVLSAISEASQAAAKPAISFEPAPIAPPSPKPSPQPSPVPVPQPIKPVLGGEAILLGTKDATKQWGVIGRCKDKAVKLDLNAPHIITVFGKMGSGKGYTIGVISEMLCSISIPNISEVGKKTTVLVLYKPKDPVRSEFWSVTSPNDVPEEIKGLAVYGVDPAQIVPPENLRIFLDPLVYKKASSKFIKEYGTQNVYPLYLDPSSLRGDEWALVLSAGGSGEPLYVKRLFKIIENLQFETFDMAALRQYVWSDSDLTQAQKKLANQRMDILATYLEPQSGGQDFTKLLAIGGVNIFDLRGTIRTPDDDFSVMTLILSLLQSKKGFESEPFAFVINEAHTYFRKGISQEFVEAVENLIRRKRHGANWLFLDSHDPGDLDEKVIELSDIKVLHFTDITVKSTALTKAFESSPKSFYELATGEALISADYSSLGSFVPLLVSIRPRLTKHGAPTKTAV
jgi:DNA helicase HerA-like ATPase